LGLILGLFTSFAAFSGAILLFIYYFNNAPIVGIEYTIPSEGNNLLVNKTLIEAMSLFVLAVFPTGSIIGLDVFINRLKIRK
jgi:thiosulfate dehydrogenase [quinone] large subunit